MTDSPANSPEQLAAFEAERDRIRGAHLKPRGSGRRPPPGAFTTPR